VEDDVPSAAEVALELDTLAGLAVPLLNEELPGAEENGVVFAVEELLEDSGFVRREDVLGPLFGGEGALVLATDRAPWSSLAGADALTRLCHRIPGCLKNAPDGSRGKGGATWNVFARVRSLPVARFT
jgi:hypothetical protein